LAIRRVGFGKAQDGRANSHFSNCSQDRPVYNTSHYSNFTNWCCQNLSKRALNELTVQASTIELDKLFQIFTMRAEKMLS